MKTIVSEFTPLRVLKRKSPGYPAAQEPNWERFKGCEIPAGEKVELDFTDCIENAVQGARYLVETASDWAGTPIEDTRLSALVVQIPDETQPIVSADASNVTVPDGKICLRLVHTSPNNDTYPSRWEYFQITEP